MVAGGEETCGARHESVQIVREPEGRARWTPQERGYGEFAPATVLQGAGAYSGLELRASFYLQTLAPTTGTPLLYAGDAVAGVANRAGAGMAILLGTFAGLCATAHTHEPSDRFVARLLERAGVVPDRCGALLRRRRVLDGQAAWFLVNPTAQKVREPVDLEGFTEVHDLLDEMLEGPANGRVTVAVPAAGIRCLVVSR